MIICQDCEVAPATKIVDVSNKQEQYQYLHAFELCDACLETAITAPGDDKIHAVIDIKLCPRPFVPFVFYPENPCILTWN